MLGPAFKRGAVRVEFSVDTRNERSQAAGGQVGGHRGGVVCVGIALPGRATFAIPSCSPSSTRKMAEPEARELQARVEV